MTSAARTTTAIRKAFGWGGSIAMVRMVCSFISIKITAVYLGPAGLVLVAQFSSFVSLFQSVLGQGLVTGAVRLSAEHGNDPARQRIVLSTGLRMGIVMAAALFLIMAVAAPFVADWLLTDRQYWWVIALSGLAVAAAMLTDYVYGSFGVTKEIGLIGTAVILSTITGLMVFATFCYFWGINGGLAGFFVVVILSAVISVAVLHTQSRSLRITDFFDRFDRNECRRILAFYPMLIVNGALPPLALILVRDALISSSSLDTAGLWQATWRLSEAYQGIIATSISLYFMPSMGERIHKPELVRQQILRTLAIAVGVTAAMAACIALLRVEIVRVVFTHEFETVSTFMPIQLMGDILKMGAWVLGMSLVALSRTAWFITITALNAVAFVGLTQVMAPHYGVHAALWAYVVANLIQMLAGAFALRDLLAVSQPLASRH